MAESVKSSSSPILHLIREMIRSALDDIHTIVPGRVAEYDSQTGRAKVQPLNKILLEEKDGEGKNLEIEIPALSNIPVCFFGSAQSTNLTHAVKPGDTGLLLVCERSIEEFKAETLASPNNPGVATPKASKTYRKFDLNDSMFFPIYFAGNKDFQGLKSKTTFGNAEIGVKNGKALIESNGVNLMEAVDDAKSQADNNSLSVKQVTLSNYWNAAAIPLVVGNDIINKITSKIFKIRRSQAFQDAGIEAYVRMLSKIGLKALRIASDGTIEKETEESIKDQILNQPDPAFVVPVQQKVIYTSGVYKCYGWALEGLNNINSGFPEKEDGETSQEFKERAGGTADFSKLNQIDPSWGDLVAVYLINGRAATAYPTASRLHFVWNKRVRLNGRITRILVSLKDRDDPASFLDSSGFPTAKSIIGDFTLQHQSTQPLLRPEDPRGSTLPGLYGIWADNGEANKLNQNDFINTLSFFSSQLSNPVYYLYFIETRDDNNDYFLRYDVDAIKNGL